MSPLLRRIIYVVTFELFAILFTTGGLIVIGFASGHSGIVAVASSTVALIWNFIWTTLFEKWESRQPSHTRTIRRRIAHAVGFEGGLIVLLVPLLAWILGISLIQAFILDIGLLLFFLVYTFVFAWIFDRVLPQQAGGAAKA